MFRGKVVDIQYAMSTQKDGNTAVLPHTFVTYDISEVFVGATTPNQKITLRSLGGPARNSTLFLPTGIPLFVVGDEDILLVEGNGKRICPLVLCEIGRLRIVGNTVVDERGRTVVGRDGDSLKFGSVSKAASRRVKMPVPIVPFEQASKDPKAQAKLKELLRTTTLNEIQARARYEREAPR